MRYLATLAFVICFAILQEGSERLLRDRKLQLAQGEHFDPWRVIWTGLVKSLMVDAPIVGFAICLYPRSWPLFGSAIFALALGRVAVYWFLAESNSTLVGIFIAMNGAILVGCGFIPVVFGIARI
jgi:hypothetical protein